MCLGSIYKCGHMLEECIKMVRQLDQCGFYLGVFVLVVEGYKGKEKINCLFWLYFLSRIVDIFFSAVVIMVAKRWS